MNQKLCCFHCVAKKKKKKQHKEEEEQEAEVTLEESSSTAVEVCSNVICVLLYNRKFLN